MRNLLATIWTKVVKTSQEQEESGKLTEKAFVRCIAVGIISIVFCLSAMGISAYAFFTSNVTSAKNTLTAATYEVNAVVKEGAESAVMPVQGTTNVYVLNAENIYEVQLTAVGNAQNGYCKIELLDGANVVETYYTKPLPPNSENLIFNITCYQEATIRITSNWGSYAGYVDNPPTGDNCLYKGGVWSTGFAIGTPATSNLSDDVDDDAENPPMVNEENSEQEQGSTPSENQQKQEEQQVEEPVEEPVAEQSQEEETADAEE